MRWIANIQASRAMFYQTTRRADKALSLYEKAYEGNTNNSAALSSYALMLLRRGKFKRSLKVARSAEACAHKKKLKQAAQLNQGLSLWKLGRLDEAIEIYEEALRETRMGSLYGTLGFLYIERGDATGDYDLALSFNREAVEYDSEDAVLLDNLAQTQMRLGLWDEAEEGFRKAIGIRPEQFDTLVCLARCAMWRGDNDEAREWLKKALERPFSHLNTVDRKLAEELASQLEIE